MEKLRNVAIIAAVALVVAFVPAGGNAADAVLTAITMGFLAAISWTLYTVSRRNELTLASLGDGRRAILYGALGLIALLIAGNDEMFASGSGTFAWIALLALAVGAIWKVWTDAQSY